MMTLDDAQCRAVAYDRAFVALGLRLKQRAFMQAFGWWDEIQLLRKHGLYVEEDHDSASDAEESARDSEQSVGLFDEGVEDDWDAEDLRLGDGSTAQVSDDELY
ncbi:unnamed protein product [Peniophora sp. CBMAI 1063]|nr:unnamed protein product [Peniophora sp. CBMAI 1063]